LAGLLTRNISPSTASTKNDLTMADYDLADQGVLVTGAGGGIGRATAIAFAKAGARVACLDRDVSSLEKTVSLLDGRGFSIVADLADIANYAAVLDTCESVVGPLGALAHVAAVLRRLNVVDVTEADWDYHLNINAKSTFFLGREFAERLKGDGRKGAVVNTASQSWWTGGLDGAIVYAASKGAIVTLTRGFARQYAQFEIRFNVVAPGFVDTPMLTNGLDESAMGRMLSQTPIGRLATPEEVANAILFLASPASSYVTGATLVVAGGQLMF